VAARVLCSLPNASTQIGGVTFVATDGGLLSDVLTDAEAKRWASIPGYRLIPHEETPPVVPRPAKPSRGPG
jgi:hypothetical protein